MRTDGRHEHHARPTGARIVRALGVLALCGATTGVAAVHAGYGCSIYDPSLLLPADSDGGGDVFEAASPDAPPEAAPNPCPEVFPPAPPAQDDPSGSADQTVVVALHTLDLGIRTDGGKEPAYGYDLDHVFTCCMGGGESCKPPVVAMPHCDEDGGRDNSGGQLLASISTLDPAQLNSDTISQRLQDGVYSLILQIQHYNGQPNDTQVTASLYASPGIEASGDAAAPPAKWDGTDIWSIDDSFVLSGVDAAPILPSHFDAHAYVSGGVLVMSLNFPISLGTSGTGSLIISLSGGVITGDLVPANNGTYRVQNGQIAGRWNVSSLLAAMQGITFGGGPICQGTAFYAGLKQQICAAADIATDPAADNKGSTCDALSIGFGFTADPALMGGVVAAAPKMVVCGDGGATPPDDCTKP